MEPIATKTARIEHPSIVSESQTVPGVVLERIKLYFGVDDGYLLTHGDGAVTLPAPFLTAITTTSSFVVLLLPAIMEWKFPERKQLPVDCRLPPDLD